MLNIGSQLKHQNSCFVKTEQYNKLVDIVNRLRQLNFDQRQFNVQNSPAGINVSLNSSTAGGDSVTQENHFEVEANSVSNTISTILVHGGSWERFVGPYQAYVPMTTDGGTSRHYANTYSINTPIQTKAYVYLELDKPEEPTTCIPKIVEIPDDDFMEETLTNITGDYNKQVIAYVEWSNEASNTLSATIEQYFDGDIIQSHLMPDTHLGCDPTTAVDIGPRRSLEVDPNDLALGLYNFDDVKPYTYSSEDVVVIRQISSTDSKPEVVYSVVKEVKIITDIRWTGTALECKSINGRIMTSDTETGWTTIDTAEACP